MSDTPGSGPLPPMALPPTPPPFGGGPTRTGPPWEHDGPLVDRFVATARSLLTEPNTFFPALRLTGGLQNPVVYLAIGFIVAGIAGTLYSFLLPGGMGRFGGVSGGGGAAFLIIYPIFGVVGSFIGAGIFHLILSLLGGARQPFEATYRVVAYVGGTVSLFNVVPLCGGVIGAVYGLYLYIVGLANVHECDTTKAAIAVLAPAVVCCAVAMLFSAAMIALVGALVAGAH